MLDLSVYSVVSVVLHLYELTLLARVILSWLPLGRDNPVVRFIYDMTEPIMRPFRGVLPPVGGLDFSPMLVFLVFHWVRGIILGFLWRLGI
ncbi:MAG: YggT family protein [Firmicutes bacterium]|jgi:YggT family protein|nr:YggT family protein [Bacillota bacterium]